MIKNKEILQELESYDSTYKRKRYFFNEGSTVQHEFKILLIIAKSLWKYLYDEWISTLIIKYIFKKQTKTQDFRDSIYNNV